MRTIALTFCVLSSSALYSQLSIIPQPVEMTIEDSINKFTINSNTKIVLTHGNNLEASVAFFQDYVKKFYNLNLAIVKNTNIKNYNNSIVVGLNPLPDSVRLKDEYSLTVYKNRIGISSRTK